MDQGAAVTAQVVAGGEAYGLFCSACHGASGQGSQKAPRLVGDGAFPLYAGTGAARTGAFHTAMDVALFVSQAMPPSPEDRAAMEESDDWNILAFALSANGVKLKEPVGPGNAASIKLN